MSRTTYYDSDNVTLIVAGIPIEDGRAEEFVTVEPEEDAFADEPSADGHVVRYATHNRRYKVSVKLKRSSMHNQQLHALHTADVLAPNGAGVGVFTLKDGNGATLMASDQCWIVKAPPVTFGKAVGDVEWLIRVVASPAQM